jgi:hypothetical protein
MPGRRDFTRRRRQSKTPSLDRIRACCFSPTSLLVVREAHIPLPGEVSRAYNAASS